MAAIPTTPKSFVRQMLDFFGPLPGQSKMQLGGEVQALSEQDKRDFADMLNDAGLPCEPPKQIAAA